MKLLATDFFCLILYIKKLFFKKHKLFFMIQKQILMGIFSFFLIKNLSAQVGNNVTQGANALACGGVTSVSSGSLGFWGNPASLAQLEYWGGAVAVENRFALTPLTIVAMGGALPTRSGVFGFSIQNFGTAEYREQKMGIQFGKKLGSKFYLGAGFDIFRLQIQNYGSRNWLSLQLGAQFEATEQLKMGIHLRNPVASRVSERETVAPSLHVGAAFSANKNVKLIAEIAQQNTNIPRFRLGCVYRVAPIFAVQLGISTRSVAQSSAISFGFSWKLFPKICLSASASLQHQLGLVSAFTFQRGLNVDGGF
ncbi:MAG: hypothetical protein RL757_614, partial [Bacteroidota bacterium]